MSHPHDFRKSGGLWVISENRPFFMCLKTHSEVDPLVHRPRLAANPLEVAGCSPKTANFFENRAHSVRELPLLGSFGPQKWEHPPLTEKIVRAISGKLPISRFLNPCLPPLYPLFLTFWLSTRYFGIFCRGGGGG